jgi:hypothetical protein
VAVKKNKTAEVAVSSYLDVWLVQANDTLRRDCRNAKPRPTNPISIIAQIEGFGTARAVGVWSYASVPARLPLV